MRTLESTSVQENQHHNADNSRSPSVSTSVTTPATADEQDNINNQADDHDVDNTVHMVVAYCVRHNISNPDEILRCLQKELVTGQPLEVTDVTQCTKGKTNVILVDRENMLSTTFDELKSYNGYCTTLEVQFYNEVRIEPYKIKTHRPILV